MATLRLRAAARRSVATDGSQARRNGLIGESGTEGCIDTVLIEEHRQAGGIEQHVVMPLIVAAGFRPRYA